MKSNFSSFSISGKSVAGVGISFPPPLAGSPHARTLPTLGGSEKGDRGRPKEERRRKRRRPLFSLCRSFLDHERGGERGEVRPSAILPLPPRMGKRKKGYCSSSSSFFPITNPIDPPLPHPQPCRGVGSSAPWMPPSPSSCFSFPFSPRGLIARGKVYRRNAFLCTHIPSHIKSILPRHLLTLRYFSQGLLLLRAGG